MRRLPAFLRSLPVFLAVLLLLLSGCAAGDDRPDDGVVRLRFQSLAWQKESVDANRRLVEEWNATHPGVQVEYVQGSWDSVHDQLLTSFEGGEAPDIVHDASDDLADFAHGGHLADLRPCCPRGCAPTYPPGAGRPPPSARGSTACRSSRNPG